MNLLLVGYSGVGKSTFVEKIKERIENLIYISVSGFVVDEVKKRYPDDPTKWNKKYFPAVGEAMRKENSITLPAELAYQEFEKNPDTMHIFDGVRFDKDIEYLRKHIFKLLVVGIVVEPRTELIERIYIRKKDSDITNKIEIENNLDIEGNSEYMNVEQCLTMLDIKIDNSGTLEDYEKQIEEVMNKYF